MTDRVENEPIRSPTSAGRRGKKLRLRLLLVILLVALAGPSSAATMVDARRAIATLRDVLQARDAGSITSIYGKDGYRTGDTQRILWDYVERDLRTAEAVLASPIRTISDPRGYAVIGWKSETIYASRFRYHNGQLIFAKHHLDVTARSAAARAAFATAVRDVPERDLREMLFTKRNLGPLERTLERLTRPSPRPRATPAAPPATATVATTGASDDAALFAAHLTAARAGNVKEMGITGWWYISGWGTVRNCSEGLRWLRQAANAGDPFAKGELATGNYRSLCP